MHIFIEMKINIGSKNPVKIKAVKEIFEMYFKNLNVKGIEVSSNVSPQPKSLEEITTGARNRAISCFNKCKYSVGLEAGIFKMPNSITGYIDVNCCVIYNGKRVVGLGLSPGFEYPPFVINKIFQSNLEVGEIFDEMTKSKNVKQKQGAVGILSHGKYPRKEFVKASIMMALFPILNKEDYNKKPK